MTTTERIVEAVIDYADYESQSDISIRIESLRTAIASVIGKEMPKIDLNEQKQHAISFGKWYDYWRTHPMLGDTVESAYECWINLPIPPKDLTPKTDTTDGE